MINNSTLTLADVKSQLTREIQDTRISDLDIIDAVNDFYSIVQRLDRRFSPEKYEGQSAALTVVDSGYDLGLLTDIGETKGIRVWKDSIKTQNKLNRTFQGSVKQGYYISGQTLFITPTPTTDQTLYISYPTKTTRIASTAVLADNLLQIDQDLERALRMYLKHSFYEGEYQFDLRNDAENKAMIEMQRYFDGANSPRSW